ncbi:uncharacterized protein EI90DRAFT_3135811 [Cantharellus anzutake]|uniref:uncharacterized protein n=1 Tax=Cantharellus anzutake TaxID=1750568 RepID=UPI0019083776|nr:uncharacterized protein EI90DRAFT_3135811 [Cantharellus anzutake]KAF8314616.1 hypothetical protein EI90DRAFT_3135811 [Cantharellus anzutake]
MPMPRSPDAPRFRGKWIVKFLNKYESLADAALFTEAQKCDFLTAYCTDKEVRFISTLDGFENPNWVLLKKDLLDFYEKGRKMKTGDHLNRYLRKFSAISKSLDAQGALTVVERDVLFFHGFPSKFRKEIKFDLQVQSLWLDLTQPPNMHDVVAAARALLQDAHNRKRASSYSSMSDVRTSVHVASPVLSTQSTVQSDFVPKFEETSASGLMLDQMDQHQSEACEAWSAYGTKIVMSRDYVAEPEFDDASLEASACDSASCSEVLELNDQELRPSSLEPVSEPDVLEDQVCQTLEPAAIYSVSPDKAGEPQPMKTVNDVFDSDSHSDNENFFKTPHDVPSLDLDSCRNNESPHETVYECFDLDSYFGDGTLPPFSPIFPFTVPQSRMHADPWERSGRVTRPETITATTVGTFWASSSPRIFLQGGANYGKSAKSRKLYSSRLPFVAASQEVEKVTLLLNSFPVKAGASPLSEFEDLGLGLDTPATRRIPLGLLRNEGRALTPGDDYDPDWESYIVKAKGAELSHRSETPSVAESGVEMSSCDALTSSSVLPEPDDKELRPNGLEYVYEHDSFTEDLGPSKQVPTEPLDQCPSETHTTPSAAEAKSIAIPPSYESEQELDDASYFDILMQDLVCPDEVKEPQSMEAIGFYDEFRLAKYCKSCRKSSEHKSDVFRLKFELEMSPMFKDATVLPSSGDYCLTYARGERVSEQAMATDVLCRSKVEPMSPSMSPRHNVFIPKPLLLVEHLIPAKATRVVPAISLDQDYAKLPPRALILTPETCRSNRPRLSDSQNPISHSAPCHSKPAIAVGHVKCPAGTRCEHSAEPQAEPPSRAESELDQLLNDLESFIVEDRNDAETPVELGDAKSLSPEVTRAMFWSSNQPLHELYNVNQDNEVPDNAKTLHVEPELDEGYIPLPEKDPDKTLETQHGLGSQSAPLVREPGTNPEAQHTQVTEFPGDTHTLAMPEGIFSQMELEAKLKELRPPGLNSELDHGHPTTWSISLMMSDGTAPMMSRTCALVDRFTGTPAVAWKSESRCEPRRSGQLKTKELKPPWRR